ncbi:MAG: peptidoglycan DD-metalloendopeptidase family protein, partial [Agromyces sp.]
APASPAPLAAPALLAAPAAPAPTPQAEPVDHSVDRTSAFAVSPSGTDAGSESGAGFDALFAGLGDEPEAPDHGGRRAEASARSPRPSRAERKAEKAAKKGDTARSAAPVQPRAVPVAPPEASAAATDDFAAVIAASAMTRAPELAPVPAADPQSAEQFAPTAVWRPSNGNAAAEQRPRRSAGADSVGARRSTGREASAAGATQGSPKAPAKGRVKRVGRVARMSSGFAAMSFAALLAVTTSVPSLSLLSPADVQAMALEKATIGSEPGQQVEITGGTLAQTVQQEGYETQTIEEYARAAGIRPEASFTNNPSGTIQWPFAVGVHVGDRFGYRDCAGCSSDHGGQDFNPGLGAEIQAIADGVVANSTDSGGSLGVVMMIDHVIDGEVVTSVYAHMVSGSRRFETGDTVKVGDVIGKTGNTGMSTGPHLHFEIRLGGMSGTKVDPLDWLYANTN